MMSFIVAFTSMAFTATKRQQFRTSKRWILLMLRIIVFPLLVIYRDPHFRWISVIHVIAAAVVIIPPEVLRIVHIRVMVQTIPILCAIGMPPLTSKCLLGLDIGNVHNSPNRGCAKQHQEDPTDHGFPPYNCLRKWHSMPLHWVGYLDHRHSIPPALKEYPIQII